MRRHRAVRVDKGSATVEREALRLTAYLGIDDRWKRRPAYVELVHRARVTGISGATVLRGIGGFGPRSSPRRGGLFSLVPDVPIIITMVDAEDPIRRFLVEAGQLLAGKLVTLERIRILVPSSATGGAAG